MKIAVFSIVLTLVASQVPPGADQRNTPGSVGMRFFPGSYPGAIGGGYPGAYPGGIYGGIPVQPYPRIVGQPYGYPIPGYPIAVGYPVGGSYPGIPMFYSNGNSDRRN